MDVFTVERKRDVRRDEPDQPAAIVTNTVETIAVDIFFADHAGDGVGKLDFAAGAGFLFGEPVGKYPAATRNAR